MATFTTAAKLEPGDEIIVPLETSRLVSHHGIYVGGPGNSYRDSLQQFNPQSQHSKKTFAKTSAKDDPFLRIRLKSEGPLKTRSKRPTSCYKTSRRTMDIISSRTIVSTAR
jgi:hypothetical protein